MMLVIATSANRRCPSLQCRERGTKLERKEISGWLWMVGRGCICLQSSCAGSRGKRNEHEAMKKNGWKTYTVGRVTGGRS